MNDFESELKRAINTRVDVVIGAPRPAPPFTAGGRARVIRQGTVRHWLIPTMAAAAVLAVALVVGFVTNGSHHAAIAPAIAPTSSASQPVPTTARVSEAPLSPTDRVVLSPVTASGELVAGWTSVPGPDSVSCQSVYTGTPASDVFECFPTSLNLPACWQAARSGHVLCLRDPRQHTVTDYAVDSGGLSMSPRLVRPGPLMLVLSNGSVCHARIGGAGNALASQPGWVEWFFCDNQVDVWGPDNPKAVLDESTSAWTVHVAARTGDGAVQTARVVSAYLAG